MKKITVSIIIIGMLLSTAPLTMGGEKAVNEERSDTGGSFDVEDETLNDFASDIGELISYNFSDDSDKLPGFAPGELIVKFKDNVEIEILGSTNGASATGATPTGPTDGARSIKDTLATSPEEVLATGIESIDQLNIEYGVISVEELFPDTTIPSLSNIYKFTFPVDTDIPQIMSEYNSDSNVVYAEPNYLFTTSYAQQPIPKEIPNDPYFSQQWALHNTGQTGGTFDADIDAPEAWYLEDGSDDVVIAIIDTGVDYNHVDLADNIWHDPVYGNPGYDFVDIDFENDYEPYGFELCPDEDYIDPDEDPMDVLDHGTHCAGIAGAVTNNSVGVAGVSWNCNIMPVRNGFKIMYYGSIYGIMEEDDSAAAIVYAVDNGADIISMSWGGFYKSQLIKDALDYAYSNDVVLVAAAGNDNFYMKFYPSGYENVISVAATCPNDERAVFSNYGEWVDVAAPGVEILSTVLYNQYTEFSGTSMACPHVAGVAGLLIAKNQECPFPAQMAKSMIPYTADDIQTDKKIGGRVNAYKALKQKPFAAVLDPIPLWEDVKGTIDVRGVAWGEDFQYFVLEIGLGEDPNSWIELLNSSTSQGGVLLSLDTTQLNEGLHTIKLMVIYEYEVFTLKTLMYVNNEADGIYTADIYVSNCFDSSTPGWGDTHFSSIQDGVDHAKYGDTVFVYDGIYPGNVSWSVKSIKLVGQSNNWTIVDGGICISLATKVTVTGFCIRGAIFEEGLVLVSFGNLILKGCSNCNISQNNIIMDEPWGWYQGIALYVSTNNIICENTIKGFPVPSYYYYGVTSFGIFIPALCFSNTISDNIIHDFQKNIAMALSSKNKILDNTLEGGDWGIMAGMITDTVIKNNYIKINVGVPLEILGSITLKSNRNKIMKNTIIIKKNAPWAICLRDAKYNKIIANYIEYEQLDALGIGVRLGQWSTDCFYNKIYYNNFVSCYGKDYGGKNSTNTWHKEKLFDEDMGNHWSVYEEWYLDRYGEAPKDENNDGIWDDPMKILREGWDGDLNEDKYPVVNPFDIENIEVSYEMTSEESELLAQFEETINSQILSGELNINDLMNSYMSIVSTPSSSPASN